eukprot:TRINITY_DN2680_c0_g2_i1.p1 TRINITY_DN2680_c0_g2~~TRINITY_DN2680_c0_g2_i1.p1  ORF type:complete len:1228 (+),score=436.96 TRINITY_DN2680_c0_g2_i1:275-3958(+)
MSRPQYNYVSTVQRPTVPTATDSGEFTQKGVRCIAVAYTTRLVLYEVTPDGTLSKTYDENLYGSVEMLQFIRPSGTQVDVLLLVLEDRTCCTLRWDQAAGRPALISQQDLSDQVGLPAENLIYGKTDPSHTFAAFSLVQGQLKIMRIKKNGVLDVPYPVRIEESRITDMCFVDPDVFSAKKGDPTIAVLYTDADKMSHIRTYSIRDKKDVLVEGSFFQRNVERQAERVERGPGGIIVIGAELISYVAPNISRAISISDFSTTEKRVDEVMAGEGEPMQAITAVCQVAGSRYYLLGSDCGKLYSLTVGEPQDSAAPGAASESHGDSLPKRAVSLELEALGYTTSPRCISWLGGGRRVAFVGSDTGDSLLVEMLAKPQDNSWFRVLDTVPSIGPITSFSLVPNHVGGLQMVTCSGKGRDASIRIVRNGVGVQTVAGVPLPGVQDLWTLKLSYDSPEHAVVALSFVAVTKFLEMQGDEIGETPVPGFSSASPTLHCGNMYDRSTKADYWVQATAAELRLVNPATRQLVSQHAVGGSAPITRAAVCGFQILVACGSTLVSLEASGGKLVEVGRNHLAKDAACIAFLQPEEASRVSQRLSTASQEKPPVRCPDGMDVDSISANVLRKSCTPALFCAVGLWTDNTVSVLRLDSPSLPEVVSEPVGCDAIPRSVLFHVFAGTLHLLAGLGDGSLITWEASMLASAGSAAAGLTGRRRIKLGTRPVGLTVMGSMADSGGGAAAGGTEDAAVFATSDKPTVLFSQGGRIQLSPVNLQGAHVAATFNSPALGTGRECLILLTEGLLVIGSINGIQKLHIDTVPVQATANCIALHRETGHYAVGLDHTHDRERPCNTLALVSETMVDNGEYVAQFDLDQDECPLSVCCCTLHEDPTEYIVVGTAFIAEEEEVKNGRILVFSFSAATSELHLVSSTSTQGGVYQIIEFQGKLAVGVNSVLYIMKWQEAGDGTRDLVSECSQAGHLVIVSLQAHGNNLLVGDYYRSVTVFAYKAEDSSLDEVGHDPVARQVTCSNILGDSCYVVGDTACNLITLAPSDDIDSMQLTVTSCFHLGHFVNAVHKGSLEPPHDAADQAEVVASAMEYCSTAAPLRLDNRGSYIFATAQGSIGSLVHLSEAQYHFLDALQESVAHVAPSVGDLDYAKWRRFFVVQSGICRSSSKKARNFVDGDLVDLFLHMPTEMQEVVFENFKERIQASAPKGEFTLTLPVLVDKLESMTRSQ